MAPALNVDEGAALRKMAGDKTRLRKGEWCLGTTIGTPWIERQRA